MRGSCITIGMAGLRVTGGERTKLAEGLKVIHGELVPHQVEKDVLERASGVNTGMNAWGPRFDRRSTYAWLEE